MKQVATPPIEIIVFDLDDTLLDTSGLLIPVASTPEFQKRISAPLPLLPGASENLRNLASRYPLFLLTQGNVDFQRQKIASLGIAPFFKTSFVFQPAENLHKGHFFQRILEQTGRPAAHHLSVGNRRSTDLREAKRLGYQTCLFQYGEHVDEKPQYPEDHPDFVVQHHAELLRVCGL